MRIVNKKPSPRHSQTNSYSSTPSPRGRGTLWTIGQQRIHWVRAFLSIFILISLFGFSASASSFVDLTEIGIGARPLGMGKAFNAIVDDGSALFMNPAGLTAVDNMSLISMSGNLLNEIPYMMVGGAWKTRSGYWGIGYIGASVGGIKEAVLINGTPEVTGNKADYGTSTIIIGYANSAKDIELVNRIDFLTDRDAAVGANFKLVSYGFSGATSFEGASGSGFDLDLGTVFPVKENLHGSFTIKNIIPGNNIKSDELPMTLVGGIAHEDPERNLLTALDLEYNDLGITLHTGAEWNPKKPLFIRCGLDQTPNGYDLAFGVGTKFRGFSFDYAYHTYAELSEFTTHYFSIGYTK
jgi:hypothetical protein